ncbi:hypothetical protein [Sphingobacterium multivorum]|uniref:Uncharacterized protein n=2 Tax=Sphingobacterium multivorum TaxID=28454 RepID=A0A654DMU5_SPHMU|nr:hypothetical protein [Sphingobacterium multivorum]VXD06709.1 conserved exported hypothetical protein [Sphingobacterium multivorum]
MKYNKFGYGLCAGLFACSFYSCSSIYMPNVPSAPMFTEAGEVYVSGNINTKANVSANLGVAVTDHVAVIANGSYVDNKSNIKDYAQKMGEAGIGYYTRFGRKNNRVFEVYGGYGLGNTSVVDKRSSTMGQAIVETKDMDFEKVFVQVNFSSEKKDALKLFGNRHDIDYGTIIRLRNMRMKNFAIDGLPAEKEDNMLIEPVFYTRMGLGKGWKLQYTNGMVFGFKSNTYLKAGYPLFTLGVLYKFGGK